MEAVARYSDEGIIADNCSLDGVVVLLLLQRSCHGKASGAIHERASGEVAAATPALPTPWESEADLTLPRVPALQVDSSAYLLGWLRGPHEAFFSRFRLDIAHVFEFLSFNCGLKIHHVSLKTIKYPY